MALEELASQDDSQSGQGFLANAPKGKGLTPAGQIAMDPKQTAELLANMQSMVDERTGAFNTFLGGLKDASAWGSGGVEGPSRALAGRDAEKAREFNDVYNMRTQMASYRAAQNQQEAFNEQQKNMFGGGKGGAGAGGVGAGTMVNGVMVDPETAAALSRTRNTEEFNKVFNDWASKRAQARGSFDYNPASFQRNVADVSGGQFNYVSPREAKAMEGRPQQVPGGQPGRQGGVSPEAIEQVESGGRPGLVSRAGAEGTMQVMPNTQTNPGFGVTPAKDKSQEELRRVGRDYYNAMQKHYGDDTLASVAYNMGPGATDAWLKKGGSFRDLPAETRDYIGQVHLANAKLNRAPAAMAPTQQGGPGPMNVAQGETFQKATTAGLEAESRKKGETNAANMATLTEAASTAPQRLASTQYLEGLVNTYPRAFGILQQPTVLSGLGKLVESGVRVGQFGDVGLKELDSLVRQSMRGATQDEIDAAQKATREFALIKLSEAKILLAGSGSVSDAERNLIQELSGSIKNSPGALKDYLAWGKLRAQFDKSAGSAYDEWEGRNPNASFRQFKTSPEFKALRAAYDQQLSEFGKSTSKPAGSQPAPQWKHTDDEYAAWKKSKGIK